VQIPESLQVHPYVKAEGGFLLELLQHCSLIPGDIPASGPDVLQHGAMHKYSFFCGLGDFELHAFTFISRDGFA